MYILEVVKCVSVERYIQTQRVLGRRGWGGRGRAWEGGGGGDGRRRENTGKPAWRGLERGWA